MSNFTYSNELYHHGIHGQKWGVRRYQNSNGTYTAEGKAHRKELEYTGRKIEKGTNVYRVIANKMEPNDNIRKYVSTNLQDNNKWIDEFKGYAPYNSLYATLYTQRYTAIKDIKVADEQKGYQVFKHMMEKDPGFANVAAKDVALKGFKISDADRIMLYNGEINPSYREFSTTLAKNTKSGSAYFKRLSDLGYDATVDFFGKEGATPEKREGAVADDPIIILNPKKTLKVNDTTRVFTADKDLVERKKREYGLS